MVRQGKRLATSSLPSTIYNNKKIMNNNKQNQKKEKTEVIIMVDITQETIKKIFNERILEMTRRTLAAESAESFEMQFSDQWIHA